MDRFLKTPIKSGNMTIHYFGFIQGNHCWRKGFSDVSGVGGELYPKDKNEANRWFLEMLVQDALGNLV